MEEKERTCDRCYKPISELPEFPSGSYYEGAKLGKTYRALYEGPEIDEYEQILDEYVYEAEPGDVWRENMNELIEKYGQEKVDQAFIYEQARNTIGSSWECIDCISK
jgi:hypothetical protein